MQGWIQIHTYSLRPWDEVVVAVVAFVEVIFDLNFHSCDDRVVFLAVIYVTETWFILSSKSCT